MSNRLNFKGFLNLLVIILTIISLNHSRFISQIFWWDFSSKTIIVLTSVIILFTSICTKNCNYSFKLQIWMRILYLILFLRFRSSSLLIFYIFFEFRLLPIVVIIYGWGYYPERHPASLYIFFYTFSASLPLLIIISSINPYLYQSINISFSRIEILFVFTAFLVKLPIFIFHLWLPIAHVEAPVYGSIVLAGIILKLGGYGLIRILQFSPFSILIKLIIAISIVGAALTCITCFFQRDIKSLVALSSVSHMRLIIAAIFSKKLWRLYSSLGIIVAHGLVSSRIFFLVNIMYARSQRRSFYINKGCEAWASSILFLRFSICACNIAAPPSINFIREIIIVSSIINGSLSNFFLIRIYIFARAIYTIYFFSSNFILKTSFYYLPVSLIEIHILCIHLTPTALALTFIPIFW